MRQLLHLCDLLGDATIRAPSPEHVQIQNMDVGGVQELAIFQHPDSRVTFELPVGFRGGTLTFGYGVKTQAWERMRRPVRFSMGIARGAGSPRRIFRATLDPRRVPADRTWVRKELTVPPGEALILETHSPRRATAHAWAGWADPILAWDAPATRPRPAPTAHPHVILITSDACRADLLGCYGGSEVPTPNLDALARESLVFREARANSTTTPGSYASLLTGRVPPRHEVLSEWGSLPAHLPNLATELGRAGYHTLFAPSEREIALPEQGFSEAFAETLPCLANPNQNGDVTTRRLIRRLDEGPDRPWFIWAHYFDTHPPQRQPDGLVRLFYQGDPRDPSRSWQPEQVARIRGVESVLQLEKAIPLLRAGHVDGHFFFLLVDTARALAGEIDARPDLAVQLNALGHDSRRGQAPDDFVRWLQERIARLKQGFIDRELMDWIQDVLPLLREVERESLAWIDGVVDYRYALAQVKASVAHLDRQVGEIVSFLKRRGLFEGSTLVFCSPHGELYGEGGQYFHHLDLMEPVLRVPLLLKPRLDETSFTPRPVDGLFESIDLLPTLLEALGLAPVRTDGGSRLQELADGRPLAWKDAFSVDSHAVRVAVCRPPFKLVRTRSWTHIDGRPAAPGTMKLYRLSAGGESPVEADSIARELESSLDSWLDRYDLSPTVGLP